jgi:hypothetical protein
MPNQVRGVLVHAMSGTELSRARTEFRLRLPEPINKSSLESRGPTLLCNQVVFGPISLGPENLLPFAPESTLQSGSRRVYSGELKRR